MQNFPMVCKSLFSGSVCLIPTAVVSQLQRAVLQACTVTLRSALSCTRCWCNLKIVCLWRFLLLDLKYCSRLCRCKKGDTLTVFRIRVVYILSGTPTGTDFFIFSSAASSNRRRARELLQPSSPQFRLCTGTLSALPSGGYRARRWVFCAEGACCTYSWSGCMSAHLHIPQTLSQSLSRAREGPSCQPAQLHSCTPQHTHTKQV